MGISLAVQWLGLHPSTAGGTGSIPSEGNKILYAKQHGEKKSDENDDSHVISAWSAKWSVHNQARDQCMWSHVVNAW